MACDDKSTFVVDMDNHHGDGRRPKERPSASTAKPRSVVLSS
jgi:hypothetical protein